MFFPWLLSQLNVIIYQWAIAKWKKLREKQKSVEEKWQKQEPRFGKQWWSQFKLLLILIESPRCISIVKFNDWKMDFWQCISLARTFCCVEKRQFCRFFAFKRKWKVSINILDELECCLISNNYNVSRWIRYAKDRLKKVALKWHLEAAKNSKIFNLIVIDH